MGGYAGRGGIGDNAGNTSVVLWWRFTTK